MIKIKQAILNEPLEQLYLIYGEDQYLQNDLFHALQQRAEQGGMPDWNWINFTADQDLQPADLINELLTPPWGAGPRIITLQDAHQLNADFLRKIADQIAKMPETNCLAMFFGRLDKRVKPVQQLLKTGVGIECQSLKGEHLVRWVQDYLSLRQKKMAPPVVQQFLNKVGTDLNLISNELDKLMILTAEKPAITEDDVVAVTSLAPGQLEHGGIFDLVTAIAAKDLKQALTILVQLLDAKEPPLRILPLIERQLYLLIAAKTRGRASTKAVAAAMNEKSDYALRQAEKYTKNFTLDELYFGLEQILIADGELKFGAEPEQIMEQLIINICT
ncbi:MAG TPA: DNA polymerase III subunit delta [Firmicutes bacterium]|nr:DNA polymerase III subunit delta [Bacillota bacterium]